MWTRDLLLSVVEVLKQPGPPIATSQISRIRKKKKISLAERNLLADRETGDSRVRRRLLHYRTTPSLSLHPPLERPAACSDRRARHLSTPAHDCICDALAIGYPASVTRTHCVSGRTSARLLKDRESEADRSPGRTFPPLFPPNTFSPSSPKARLRRPPQVCLLD